MRINYDIQSSNKFRGINQIAEFDISNYKFQILSSFDLKFLSLWRHWYFGGKSSFSIN